MPRALVTGGTGFTGSHIAAALAKAGWSVRTVDVNAPDGSDAGAHEFVRADTRDAEAMREAVRGCEVVVENAALVPVTRSSVAEFRSVNVDGCVTTLDAAEAEGAYVVRISSCSVYGLPKQVPTPVNAPLAPFEPYGRSKAEAEALVAARREGGLRIASFRPRTLLGPGRLGIFEVIFARVRAGKRVPIFGRGENRAQLCSVEDLCTAVLAAIERRASGDYNLGSAGFGTVREDIEALIAHAGTGATVLPVPAWAIRAVLQPLDTIGRSPFTKWHWGSAVVDFYLDLSLTTADLGWRPRHTNIDMLVRSYDDYLRHADDSGPSAHRRPLRGALARMLRASR
jgi:nucleoside-diphosphate-sugar epimerase